MLVYLKVTKREKDALLLFYPSVRFFLQKALLNKANQIIEDEQISDYKKELEEYHQRQALNAGVEWKPGTYFWEGRKHTQETKNKISATLIKRYEGKKFPMLEETRIKIGLTQKGKTISQTTRDKLSKANTGKKRTEEQRQNISKGHTGMHYKKRVKVSKEKVECLA